MTGKSLVTGGAGVIGRALVEALIASDEQVRVIDIQPPPSWLHPRVDYVQADLRHIHRSVTGGWRPNTIYHLAATFERTIEGPEFWHENAEHNIRLSHNLLRGLDESGWSGRFVFASSYLVYDETLYMSQEVPHSPVTLTEDVRVVPRNLCGLAKLLFEAELQACSEARPFSHVSARIYRVYGRGSRDIVGRWIRSALRGEPLELFGKSSYFDYIFADDVATGLMQLAKAAIVGPVNLGSGVAHRVADVVSAIELQVRDTKVREVPSDRAFEASQAGIDRLYKATEWSPNTGLYDGIGRVIAHEYSELESGRLNRRAIAKPAFSLVITSSSAKGPLVGVFREALLSLSLAGAVWGADSDDQAPSRLDVDEFWEMAPLERLQPAEVVAFCRQRGIRLVVPTRDGELRWWSDVKGDLVDAGTYIGIGTPQCIDVCQDKLEFARVCAAMGVQSVPTATRLDDIDGERLVVKERYGAGSRGLYLDVSRVAAASYGSQLAAPIYQRYAEGQELSIDVYILRDGEPHAALARSRDLVRGGESQVSTLARHGEVEEACLALAVELGVRGPAVFQGRIGSAGFSLIECNPRIGGASTLSSAGGLRFAQWLVQEACNDVPTRPRMRSDAVRLQRRPSDGFVFPLV